MGRQVWEYVLLAYFAIHIPLTIVIDSQPVAPKGLGLHPKWLVEFVQNDYAKPCHDYLMENPPPWFLALLLSEVSFQIPFFCYAIYAVYHRKKNRTFLKMF